MNDTKTTKTTKSKSGALMSASAAATKLNLGTYKSPERLRKLGITVVAGPKIGGGTMWLVAKEEIDAALAARTEKLAKERAKVEVSRVRADKNGLGFSVRVQNIEGRLMNIDESLVSLRNVIESLSMQMHQMQIALETLNDAWDIKKPSSAERKASDGNSLQMPT